MLYGDLRIQPEDDTATRRWKTRTTHDLQRLRAALNAAPAPGDTSRAPGRDQGRLRIATWNLREFDSGSYGYRLPEAFFYLAEVISAFDLVALQEVRGDLRALRRLMRLLGPDWDSIMTDADEGPAAHNERMVFVFDTTRVRFQGTAGELNLSGDNRLMLPDSVDLALPGGIRIELPDGATLEQPDRIPSDKVGDGDYRIDPAALVDLPEGTRLVLPAGTQLAFKDRPADFGFDVVNNRIANKRLDLQDGSSRAFSDPVRLRWPSGQVELASQQFARTPFIVYFQAAWVKIALCTVHIFFGSNSEGSPQLARRRAEIAALTAALSRKAREKNDSDANSFFAALGDFNIKSPEHETMSALRANGFEVPERIREIPAGSNVARDKYYDQIAFWQGDGGYGADSYARLEVADAGIFDVFRHVYRQGDEDPGGADEAYFRARMAEVGRSYADYRAWRTHQMSDHLPMWVEIESDFADAYLDSLVAGA